MPLMQSNNGSGDGEFKIYCKYNAKAGRFYTRPDEPNGEEYEITNFTALFDMDNVRTGWFLFAAGVAPVKNFDPSITEAGPRPGPEFKRGFEVDVYSDKNLGGVREFASTAGAVIDAINTVYDAWEADKDANAGKLPVIKCTGVKPVTNKHGTNYAPQLAIVGWVDRPKELTPTKRATNPAIEKAQAQRQAAKPATAPAEEALDDSVVF